MVTRGPKVGSFRGTTGRLLLRILCSGIVLTMAQFLYSQRIIVSEDLVIKEDLAYDVLGLNDKTYLIRDRGNDYEVRCYDDQMQLRWARPLELEKRSADLITVIRGDGVLHLLYGYRQHGDYTIMHRVYSPDLALLDTVVVHVDTKEYFTPSYRAEVSEDHSKVLLVQAEREDQVSGIVYSLTDKKVLLDQTVQTDQVSVRRGFREMLVSNAGDAEIIYDEERLSDRNRTFNILHLDPRMQHAEMQVVELGDLVAADLHCTIDNVHQKLLLAGLYNERIAGKSRGMYLASMDLADGRTQVRTVLFDPTLLQNVYGKEVSENRGLTDFSVQDIALRQDGGALLIAEMQKEYSRRPNMPGRHDFDYPRGGWVDYYYEDLIVYALNPDGSEHWNAVLHKKQYSQDDDAMYSSYFLFRTPEKLHLLFNDEIRQENMVSEYVIRGNGYYRRQSVFSTAYQHLRLRLRAAVQVSWNSCVVPSEHNGKLNLVKITFDDDDETAGR